jgi:hypothetical protein
MAYANIHIVLKFGSTSPLVEAPTIHFDYFASSSAALANDVQDLVNKVTASFGTTPVGASHNASYLGGILDRGVSKCQYEAYDVTSHLDGTPHGSPVVSGNWTLAAGSGLISYAEGIAAVVTLQAPYGTDVEYSPPPSKGRPRSRDRGRIYLGPLNSSNTISQDVNNRNYILPAARTDLCAWIKSINVITTTTSSIPYNLAVWSRVNKIMKSLAEVWVDDRLDYHRPRAGISGAKTVLSLP